MPKGRPPGRPFAWYPDPGLRRLRRPIHEPAHYELGAEHHDGVVEVGTGEARDAVSAGALDAPAPTSWTFQDLGDVLDGKANGESLEMLREQYRNA